MGQLGLLLLALVLFHTATAPGAGGFGPAGGPPLA